MAEDEGTVDVCVHFIDEINGDVSNDVISFITNDSTGDFIHALGFFVWRGRLYAKIDCVQSMQNFLSRMPIFEYHSPMHKKK